mgnify:CR=1 FL=1
MPALHELPPGYTELRRYNLLTDRKLLFTLNIAALIPFAVVLVLMLAWLMIVARIHDAGIVQPLDFSMAIPSWLLIVGLLVIVLPFHEILHGLVMKRLGHNVRYGVNLKAGVLYALAENALFRRNEYLMVLLTPITVITVLGMLLTVWLPDDFTFAVVLAVVMNAGGAIGDLWMSSVILRHSRRLIIRDDATGFTIYSDE